MRFRYLLLVLGLGVLAAFVALNLDEFSRPAMLFLGYTSVPAPLGLVMLALLLVALLVFIMLSAYAKGIYMLESRRTARELTAQRELADKAEASRLNALRDELGERLVRLQHALEIRIDQNGNSLAAYIGELEGRLERRPLDARLRDDPDPQR